MILEDSIETKSDTPSLRARPGRYLAFFVADEQYAVEILTIREIIGMLPITRLPGTPPHLLGVVNLRGSVVPVADLRACLGLPQVEATRETCILVLELEGRAQGVVVDRVAQVVDIDAECLSGVSELGPAARHLLGLARGPDRVTMLLDPESVIRT